MIFMNRTGVMSRSGRIAKDPYITSVKLLLHCEGSDGGTTFTDSSPVGRATTFVSATTSTAQFKFGSSSALFDAADEQIRYAAHADFYFPGEFTIEAFARTSSAASFQSIFAAAQAGDTEGYAFQVSSGSLRFFDDNGTYNLTGGSGLADGNWHHIAVTRDSGNTIRLLADGSVLNSDTRAGTMQPNSTSFYVGSSRDSGGGYFTGNIDEVRITNGVARYTGSYVVPTAAFPNQ